MLSALVRAGRSTCSGWRSSDPRLWLPSEDDWERLESAEVASGHVVATTEKLNMTDLLKVFLPAAEKPFAERNESEKAEMSVWYAKFNWFASFRKIGLVPSFEAGSVKQARLS